MRPCRGKDFVFYIAQQAGSGCGDPKIPPHVLQVTTVQLNAVGAPLTSAPVVATTQSSSVAGPKPTKKPTAKKRPPTKRPTKKKASPAKKAGLKTVAAPTKKPTITTRRWYRLQRRVQSIKLQHGLRSTVGRRLLAAWEQDGHASWHRDEGAYGIGSGLHGFESGDYERRAQARRRYMLSHL